MATNPRTTISEPIDLKLVPREPRKKPRSTRVLVSRVISTAVALLVLGVVFLYLPSGLRNSPAQDGNIPIDGLTDDLQLGRLQMSLAPAGEGVYIDGVAKNAGYGNITAATLQVDFHDAQGNVVSSEQKPIVGMARGGTDLVRNEFKRNPILPNEMRFFRVAVDQVPPGWNHELPEVKVVEVKTQ